MVGLGNVTALVSCTRVDGVTLGVLFALQNQTKRPVRILLLDASKVGVSSSSSLSALIRYLPVEVFRAPGMLLYPARNWLVQRADTEWVWFVDDDFMVDHACLFHQMDAASRYGVGLVGAMRVNLAGPTWGEREFCFNTVPRRSDVSALWCDLSCALVGRQVWLENCGGMHFEAGIAGEDVAITARVAEKCGCVIAGNAFGLHIPWDGQGSCWGNAEFTPENVDQFEGLMQARHHLSLEYYVKLRDCFLDRLQIGAAKVDME